MDKSEDTEHEYDTAKMRAAYPISQPRSVSLEITMDVHELCEEIDRLVAENEARLADIARILRGETTA